jgi:mercuric ion binding protein
VKPLRAAIIAVAALGTSSGASAGERSVTLEVGNLFCATCPYIVEQALAAVPGVASAQVSYQEKTAVVTFDDETTTVAALTAATAAYGFPSRPAE